MPGPKFRRAAAAWLLPWAVMVSTVALVSPYPSGAPPGTCGAMVPYHSNAEPQTSAAPYGVAPARPRTDEGRVRLKLSSHQGVPFLGFLLQARDPAGNPIGTFTGLPDATQHLACADSPKVN